MNEQYVSLEVSKFLKEKGFNGYCHVVHINNHNSLIGKVISNSELITTHEYKFCKDQENCITIPTQQMACQWLREVYNILVCVLPCEVGAGVMDYTYCIYRIHADNYYFEPLMQGRISESINYEKTLEAGLEFVLKNII